MDGITVAITLSSLIGSDCQQRPDTNLVRNTIRSSQFRTLIGNGMCNGNIYVQSICGEPCDFVQDFKWLLFGF